MDDSRILRIVVQNLQKQSHLATNIIMSTEYKPDVLLAQEINVSTEDAKLFVEGTGATNVSKCLGYGTAILYSKHNHSNSNNDDCSSYYLTNIRRVDSPHAETGGFIRKKTIIATLTSGTSSTSSTKQARNIQFVSFHGYNGQPFKKVSYLVDHVQAVLDVLDHCDDSVVETNNNKNDNDEPTAAAVFAGDFNTWSQAHLDAIQVPLQRAGFRLAMSWPYPGRDFCLDHVFIRGRSIQLQDYSIFENLSDHQGALLTLAIEKNDKESS